MRNPVKRMPRFEPAAQPIDCGRRICCRPARWYREVGTGTRRSRILRCTTCKRASGQVGWNRLTNFGGVA